MAGWGGGAGLRKISSEIVGGVLKGNFVFKGGGEGAKKFFKIKQNSSLKPMKVGAPLAVAIPFLPDINDFVKTSVC